MAKEQEYNHLLDGLLVGVNMENDVSRKMGYNSCLAYAQQELDSDPDVNQFIAMAAQRLGQVRVHFGVGKGMVPMPEDARLHLKYEEQSGPVLTGNAAGLHYLSDLSATLADAPLPDGEGPEEHVHLYGNEPPMFGQSYGLTIYHSSDEWFDRHAVAPDDAEADAEDAAPASPPPQEITPDQVAAIEFFRTTTYRSHRRCTCATISCTGFLTGGLIMRRTRFGLSDCPKKRMAACTSLRSETTRRRGLRSRFTWTTPASITSRGVIWNRYGRLARHDTDTRTHPQTRAAYRSGSPPPDHGRGELRESLAL